MNEEQRSIILQTKNCPGQLLIHRNFEISQNVDEKMMAVIPVKMRNPGFEISLNLVFWMVIIAQNDHAVSQKMARPFN